MNYFSKATAIALVIALPTLVAAAPQYTIVDLGTFGGTWMQPRDMNSSGQVVGMGSYSDNRQRGFLADGGPATDLGTFGFPYSNSFANGINDAGVVVGYSYTTDYPVTHALLADQNGVHDLGAFGYYSAVANRINNSGQIAGGIRQADGQWHGALIQNGVVTDFGSLGGDGSGAAAINEVGQITGYATTVDQLFHAVLFENGQLTDLGTLPGNTSSYGSAINRSGQVIGSSYGDGDRQLFLYSNGVMQPLGNLGGRGSFPVANDINDNGQVVGAVGSTSGYDRAFLYSNGAMHELSMPIQAGQALSSSTANAIDSSGQVVGSFNFGTNLGPGIQTHAFVTIGGVAIDLNSLLGFEASGWTLNSADEINDRGQIAGEGMFQGQHHAFLLNPIPEPSTLVLGLLGALGIYILTCQRSR